jgi:hypothetical protein
MEPQNTTHHTFTRVLHSHNSLHEITSRKGHSATIVLGQRTIQLGKNKPMKVKLSQELRTEKEYIFNKTDSKVL